MSLNRLRRDMMTSNTNKSLYKLNDKSLSYFQGSIDSSEVSVPIYHRRHESSTRMQCVYETMTFVTAGTK